MENKICTICDMSYPLDNFTHDKKGKLGRASRCKQCRGKNDKLYRNNNRDKETKRVQYWRKNNPKKAKESYLKYRAENIDRLRQEALEKQKLNRKNPIYKLKESIRNNIRKSMNRKGISKTTKTTQILGCSFDEFKTNIESLFEPWMTWDNRGLYNGGFNYGWDLDHIVPMALAKTEKDILLLNHYSNFQPLCSHINRDIKKDNLL